MMKIKIFLLLCLFATGFPVAGQRPDTPLSWNLNDCINYAVEHNRNVRTQVRINRDTHLNTIESYTAFLPNISGGIGAQFSFGRTIDPETNTYNTVSNFSNSYSINASLPLFNSGTLINGVHMARVQELMGRKNLEQLRDNIAMNTLQAYTDVLYYRELHTYRQSKAEESERQLHRLRTLHELGRRSTADLALVEAQCEADRHGLIETQTQMETALLTLHNSMNLPPEMNLEAEWLIIPVATGTFPPTSTNCRQEADSMFYIAEMQMPVTVNARYSVAVNRLGLRRSLGELFPSLSLSAGLSSGYFKTLEQGDYASFHKQFRDKLGYYVGISLNIPVFGRLNRVYNVKRQRNRLLNAMDDYEQKRDELQQTIRQTVMEREAAAQSVTALQKQLTADSLAYTLTSRRFEEGLVGALELQAASANLIRSRATLLQSRLTYFIKRTQTDYYNGRKLYTL